MKKALTTILSLLLILSPSITKTISEHKKAVASLGIFFVIVGGGYLAYTWSDQVKKEDDALMKELRDQSEKKQESLRQLQEQQQNHKNQQEQNIFNSKHQDTKTTTLDQQEQQPETEPKSSPTGDLLRALDEHKKVNSQQTKDLIQKVEDQTKDIIQKIEEIGKRIDEISKVEEMQAKRQGQCEALLKALQNSFDHNY